MHGADQRVALGQLEDAGLEVVADGECVGLQALSLDLVEHGQPHHARHRAAAGRGEEVALGAVGVGDLPGGDHRTQRLPVAHRLGDAHDVGHHALLLERPEPPSGAAVAHLDLVGDRQAAHGAHRRVDRRQVSVRQRHPAGVAVEGFADECGGRFSLRSKVFDDRHGLRRVPARIRAAVLPAVGVRRGHGVHPGRPGGQRVGVVGDRGRDRVGGVGPAVVGLRDGDDVVAAGGGHGQPQRQVVGLGAGVHQEHGVQRVGQGGRQPLGQLHHGFVVEPRVGVQPPPLPGHRVGQAGMAVPEHGHVVDHVEIAAAVGVEHVLAPAPFDPGRVGVVVLLHAGERAFPPPPQGGTVIGGTVIGGGVVGGAVIGGGVQQDRGVADEAQPAVGVLRPDEPRHLRAAAGAAEVNPDRAVDHAEAVTGGDLRRPAPPDISVGAHRAAHLEDAVRPGQRQPSRVGVERSRPRRAQRHRRARPHLHTGGHRRGGHSAQGPRPGQPRLTEHRHHPGGSGGQGLGRQLLLALRVQPRAGVHRVGLHRQIQSRQPAAQQRRAAGDRCRGGRRAQSGADLLRHHPDRDLGGALEDPPLVIQRRAGIGVGGVDAVLVDTADHQHRGPQHH